MTASSEVSCDLSDKPFYYNMNSDIIIAFKNMFQIYLSHCMRLCDECFIIMIHVQFNRVSIIVLQIVSLVTIPLLE